MFFFIIPIFFLLCFCIVMFISFIYYRLTHFSIYYYIPHVYTSSLINLPVICYNFVHKILHHNCFEDDELTMNKYQKFSYLYQQQLLQPTATTTPIENNNTREKTWLSTPPTTTSAKRTTSWKVHSLYYITIITICPITSTIYF